MNTYRLESLLEQYNPENDLGPITYTDAALLEVVIDLAERVRELEATTAKKPTQPESATDRPASAERIAMEARNLSPSDKLEPLSEDAKLFLDLIDAAGWVGMFYRELDLANHPDPDAASFLASEAKAIHERALLTLKNWAQQKKHIELTYRALSASIIS